MNKKLKYIAWICLILSILMLYPAARQRFHNEADDKSLVIAADIKEFIHNAHEAGISDEALFASLLEAGVSTAAVSETKDFTPCTDSSAVPGFDADLASKLSDRGFNILLRAIVLDSYSGTFTSRYRELLDRFSVKYIIFDEQNLNISPDCIRTWSEAIGGRSIVLGLVEAPSLVGHIAQSDLEKLSVSPDVVLKRTHIIPESVLARLNPDDMFFRWVRCAVDRNIRIIYVRPLRNPAKSALQNLNDTLLSLKKFHRFISDRGYRTGTDMVKPAPSPHNWVTEAALILCLAASLLLYFLYLPVPGIYFLRFRLPILLSAAVAAATAILLAISSYTLFCKLTALVISIIYPSFSSLLMLVYLRYSTHKTSVRLLLSTLVVLSVNAIGMYIIASALSDARFMINLESFDGVPLTYIIPIILFPVNYCICFNKFKKVYNYLRSFGNLKFSLKGAAGAAFGMLSMYIYLSRSGGWSIIPASYLELETRKLLEYTFLARPRFKEIIIGYPCLLLFAYLHKNNRNDKLLTVLGTSAVIGSISMINSFCHVYTSIQVSALRVFNGVLLGIPLALTVLSAAILIEHTAGSFFSVKHDD